MIAKNFNNNTLLWKLKIIGKYDFLNFYGAKISFHNDSIYVTTRLNEIISINKNGTLKWKKTINSIPISTPVIDDKNVYVTTSDNKTYIFNTTNGKIEWIHYSDYRNSNIFGSSDVLLYKNYIIISYSSAELFIIDKNSKETIFNTNLSNKSYIFSNFELNDIDSTPIIKNDILIATANSGNTIAIDLKNMKILWKKNIFSLINLLINNDNLFLMTNDNKLVSINFYNGNINYIVNLDLYKNLKKKKNKIYYTNIIFANNNIYAFNNYGEVKIINPEIGKLIDTINTDFYFLTKPFSLNNSFYSLVSKNKKFYLINM